MIKQPPQESSAWSWCFAWGWAIIIWLTVPFARKLEKGVEAFAGNQAFTIIVLFLIGLGALGVLITFWKDRKRFSSANYIWLAAVIFLLAWQTLELRHGSPIEALHFVEYGVLALLFFRAAVHRNPNPAAYVIAFCCCLCVGLLDESYQWMTPQRYFDWRDIGLNAYASFLICILLARGLVPPYIGPAAGGHLSVALKVILIPISLAMLCLMNTPRMKERLVEAFPVLEESSQSWGVMTEYGYAFYDLEIGQFKSRFSKEALAEEDRVRGFDASQILSLRRYTDYGDFLREFSETSDPYIHEARVHLHQREYYLKSRIEHRGVDDAEYRRRTNIAYREELILRKYFPVLMKDYWHQISPEWWADMQKELPEVEEPYFSKVSQGLIVRFSQRQALLGYCTLVFIILGFSHWLKHRD